VEIHTEPGRSQRRSGPPGTSSGASMVMRGVVQNSRSYWSTPGRRFIAARCPG